MTTTQPKIAPPGVGVHENVPFGVYLQWDAVNPSLVKSPPRNMKRIKWDIDHGDSKKSKSLDMGADVDLCVLEPDSFLMQVAVWKGARRVGKEYDAFEAANDGKVLLNTTEYMQVVEIRDAIRTHPMASKLFASRARMKPSLVWDNPATGTLCKGQPDYVDERIVDLKTCRDLDDRALDRAVIHFGYHVASGAYTEAYDVLAKRRLDTVLLFVCTAPPYDVVVRPMSPDLIDYGIKEWNRLLAEMKECQASGHWPGRAENEEVPIELPTWLEDKLDLTLDGKPVEELA